MQSLADTILNLPKSGKRQQHEHFKHVGPGFRVDVLTLTKISIMRPLATRSIVETGGFARSVGKGLLIYAKGL